jgi:tRNA threonylcarbamoyl adenosine modification protein YeaZ
VLLLAWDTATDVATCALVWDGEVVAEASSRPLTLLEDVDALLRRGGVRRSQLEALVLGTGPGSFTGIRMGLAAGRALALALDLPAAGVSTLDALAAGAPGALPVIDARRREVFTQVDGASAAVAPADVRLARGTACVGDGAVRYRAVLEGLGAVIPPDDAEVHVPHARHHAALATDFGAADLIEPVYLRIPDAERARQAAADVP